MNQRDVGVAIINLSHELLWVDDAFGRLLGHLPRTLIGKNFESITHPDDVGLDRTLATRLLAGDLDHYEMEKRYIHRDKSVVPVHMSVCAIRDRRGNVLYAAGAVETIASRARLAVHTGSPMTPEEKEMDRIRRAMLG
jgi:PAS domain S-box-containing protein